MGGESAAAPSEENPKTGQEEDDVSLRDGLNGLISGSVTWSQELLFLGLKPQAAAGSYGGHRGKRRSVQKRYKPIRWAPGDRRIEVSGVLVSSRYHRATAVPAVSLDPSDLDWAVRLSEQQIGRAHV